MATKQSKDRYYLFGEDVSKTLEREGLNAALAVANTYGYELYHWDSKSTPDELLGVADGWLGYTNLTKRQYNAFAKL